MQGYIPGIDGLRAIAVIAVLGHHALIPGFQGGFLGVDIFFVISGYLITGIVMNELAGGTFSYRRFLVRRAARLFPAMLAVTAVTFLAGTVFFPPSLLGDLGGSVVYSLPGLANIYFWLSSGYFDAQGAFKPLLHFWSLGVEQQFYLVLPLLMVAVYPRGIFGVILAISLLSLIASEAALHAYGAAVFYLMPFRIFEFGVGALGAISASARVIGMRFGSVAVAVGFLLLAGSLLILTENHSLPGFLSLLPCAGAFLCIIGARSPLASRTLARAPFVYVGRISYSLYLVHWPIIVFYRLLIDSSLDPADQAAVFLLSFAAAIPLYHFVEKPFRAMGKGILNGPQRRQPALAAGAAAAVILVVSAADSWGNRGWFWRYPSELVQLTEHETMLWHDRNNYWREICPDETMEECGRSILPGSRNILVLGDSHGAEGLYALNTAFPKAHYLAAFRGACPPFLDVGKILPPSQPERAECVSHMERVLGDRKLLSQVDVIVFSSLWNLYDRTALSRTVDYLRSVSDADIVIFGPPARYDAPMPQLLLRAGELARAEEYIRGHTAWWVYDVNSELEDFSRQKNLSFVNLLDLNCPDAQCIVFAAPDVISTIDDNHWTLEMSMLMGQALRERYGSLDDLIEDDTVASEEENAVRQRTDGG